MAILTSDGDNKSLKESTPELSVVEKAKDPLEPKKRDRQRNFSLSGASREALLNKLNATAKKLFPK